MYCRFQSPYGGRGRSDWQMMPYDNLHTVSFNHLTVAGVGQTPLTKLAQRVTSRFQSPCGGRGRSDEFLVYCTVLMWEFQSPYGGIGASDCCTNPTVCSVCAGFQSPCGGIGALDRCS